MVIVGLGSNEGDRLAYLRRALLELKKLTQVTVITVSPVYHSQALLPPNANKSWNKPYLNAAVRCETTLHPLDFLEKLKEIEKKLNRVEISAWGPRTIDIDLLAWDDRIIEEPALKLPHPGLLTRPFALWPLADVAPDWIYPVKNEHCGKNAEALTQSWGSRFTGQTILQTKQIHQRIDTLQFIGILNITPDSFSRDGIFKNPTLAWKQAKKHVEAGATVLDIGAESTRPGAKLLSPSEEWRRLAPILEGLLQRREKYLIKPKISVDTYHPLTAKQAIALGVDWINDVTGFFQ